MTQRATYTKEMIVEAAFTLTRELGWAAVTARNVAKKLSCSTMPIYSSLKSMDEIEREVRRRAEALLIHYQQKHYTGNAALNSAVGYVGFARKEANLFRFIYVDRPLKTRRRDTKRAAAVSAADVVAGKSILNLADQVPMAMRDPRILKCWIFIHGLASMIGSGVLDLTETTIRSLLVEAGGALFRSGGERNA